MVLGTMATCFEQKKKCPDGTFRKKYNNKIYTCCECMGGCKSCLNENRCTECYDGHGLATVNDTVICRKCSAAHCLTCGEREVNGEMVEKCFECPKHFIFDVDGTCKYDGNGEFEQAVLFVTIISCVGLIYVVGLTFAHMIRRFQKIIPKEESKMD